MPVSFLKRAGINYLWLVCFEIPSTNFQIPSSDFQQKKAFLILPLEFRI